MTKRKGPSSTANLLIAGSIGCASTVSVHAQTGPRLEEVLVTAERREASLQDVPIAVTAFGGEFLEDGRLNEVSDIALRTPGFSYTSRNGAAQELFIRGIGTAGIEGAAADPSVIMMVDDVYVGRMGAGISQYFDLERLEVLRGPQGTLYGKNAVGGVVNITTRKPQFDTAIEVRAGIGNENSQTLDAYITGALSDSVAGKVTVMSRQRDGFRQNVFFDREIEDEDSTAIRGQLLFNLTDHTEALFSAGATRDRSNGTARKPVGGFGAAAVSQDVDINESESLTFTNRDTQQASLRVDHRFDFGEFVSITGYQTSEIELNDDLTGIGLGAFPLRNANGESEDNLQLSQEFRLSDRALDDRLFWVTGVYYLYEDNERLELVRNETAPPFDVIDFFNGHAGYDSANKTHSFGVFAEGTYDFTEKLALTVGARYTLEEKDYDIAGYIITNPVGPLPVTPLQEEFDESIDDQWNAFTPRLALHYDATDSALVYGSISRGFKSGGFQAQPGTGDSARIPYDPEFAVSYEIGAKTRWFNDRLQANVAAFFIDYTDLQVSQLTNINDPENLPTLVVSNAANAQSSGVEIEVVAQATSWLQLFASYGYLDTEYDEFIDADGVDLSGNQLQRAPEDQLNLGFQIDTPIRNLGTLQIRGDYSYQSEFFYNPNNLPVTRQDSFEILSGYMNLLSPDERWMLSLWGKNLGDEEYSTHILSFAGTKITTFAPPRTFGVSVTYSFN